MATAFQAKTSGNWVDREGNKAQKPVFIGIYFLTQQTYHNLMRKLWGLFLCLILFVGCGIDDYVVSRYNWQDVSKIYDRPDKSKIIGFYENNRKSIDSSPITISDTKLTLYGDYLMRKIYFQFDFKGKVIDYSISTINNGYNHIIVALLVKNTKTSIKMIIVSEADRPEVVEISVGDDYDKIVASYDIDMLRKFVVIHSRTGKMLGIVDYNTKTCREYKVPNAIFTDVSCIRQKLKTITFKYLNYKSTSLSCYLASYDGKAIQLYDCDDGKLIYGNKITLSQTGDVVKATMNAGKNFHYGFRGSSMFHLSLYDGKTLFIIDLTSLKVLYQKIFNNFKDSLYHCLFLFDEGLHFYDAGQNKLVWLMDGDIRLINSVTVNDMSLGIGFYICNDFDKDSKKHFLWYLGAYNFYEVGRFDLMGIKNFALGKYQVVGDDYETIYSNIVYCRSQILSY